MAPTEQTSTDKLNPADAAQTEAKGETAEEELCSTSAVIENITEVENLELLEMLVENILKGIRPSSATPDFILEVIPDNSSVVVTFQSGKGIRLYVSNVCVKKMIAAVFSSFLFQNSDSLGVSQFSLKQIN